MIYTKTSGSFFKYKNYIQKEKFQRKTCERMQERVGL